MGIKDLTHSNDQGQTADMSNPRARYGVGGLIRLEGGTHLAEYVVLRDEISEARAEAELSQKNSTRGKLFNAAGWVLLAGGAIKAVHLLYSEKTGKVIQVLEELSTRH